MKPKVPLKLHFKAADIPNLKISNKGPKLGKLKESGAKKQLELVKKDQIKINKRAKSRVRSWNKVFLSLNYGSRGEFTYRGEIFWIME